MKQTRGKVVNSLFLEVRARWFSRSTLVKCQTIKGLNGWYFLLCVIKKKWDQSSLFFPALNSLWDCGSSECLGLCFGVERNCNTFTCIMFLYVTCNISHNCLFTCLPTNKMSVKRERDYDKNNRWNFNFNLYPEIFCPNVTFVVSTRHERT